MKQPEKIEDLRRLIDAAPPQSIVFFGGAGVSTESGIPDFRSPDGIFAQKYPLPPETMISHTFFEKHPAQFYDFYCDAMIFPDAQPNQAHRKLAELEAQGKLRAVITQNIDGLHQAAGSKRVLELHGSVLRNFCTQCHAPHRLEEMLAARDRASDGIPRCLFCEGTIKPDVVLYEEALDEDTLVASIAAIAASDLLIIAGTSLSVYPAASLIDYFRGSSLVIINRSPTSRDKQAELCITEDVGVVFDW